MVLARGRGSWTILVADCHSGVACYAGVSGLDDTGLVQGDQEHRQRQNRADAVADEIKERFGRGEKPRA